MEYYKKNLYDNYVQSLWKDVHSFSRQEYDFYAKVIRKKFLKFLPQNKNASILDCACGAGHFIYFLKKEGYINAVGIDLSDQQVEMCRSIGLNNVLKADFFEYLQDKKDKFDLIIAFDIIEHFKKNEVLNLLRFIYDALKNDGKVIIKTLNAFDPFFGKRLYDDFTHEQAFTDLSLKQVLFIAGFNKDINIIGDKPVVHDLRSLVRSILWEGIKSVLKGFLLISEGSGRGCFKKKKIFEPNLIAVAKK